MSEQSGDLLVENIAHSNLPSTPLEGGLEDYDSNVGSNTVSEKSELGQGDAGTEDGKQTEEVEYKDGWIDILGNGHLLKKTLQPGEGLNTRPDRGHNVTVSYTLTLEDGTLVEEQNNFIFTVGDADVIQGLDLCLPLMEVGEQVELKVNPRFGYGKLGLKPNIPSDATLCYTLTLHSAELAPEPETLSMEQRLKHGETKRNKGNFWYSREDYSQAMQCYRRCIDYLDDEHSTFQGTEEENKVFLSELLKAYNNQAATQIKMEAFEAAIKSVDLVLRLEPNNVKALFRKGKILGCTGETEEAIKCLRKALQLEPETRIIHQELSRLITKEKTEIAREKDLYKRMLGSSKPKTPKTQSRSRFLAWGLAGGSIVVAAVGVLAFKLFQTPS